MDFSCCLNSLLIATSSYFHLAEERPKDDLLGSKHVVNNFGQDEIHWLMQPGAELEIFDRGEGPKTVNFKWILNNINLQFFLLLHD